MNTRFSRLVRWFWILCILLYAAFLSLPYVTDVGFLALRYTAERTQKELQTLAEEIEKFHSLHHRYPFPSPSSWITDASLTVGGQSTFLIPPGLKSQTIFDPFIADGYTQPIRYYGDGDSWYVLASNGPDQDEDITARILEERIDLQDRQNRSDVNRHDRTKPSYELLHDFIYHPSRGNLSEGDVLEIGPN